MHAGKHVHATSQTTQAACKIQAQLQDTLQALQTNACFPMHF